MVLGEMEPGSAEDHTSGLCRADVRSHSLRCTIAQQCMDSGWHGITESSLTALVDVLDRYLKNMSRTMAGYTELAGRQEPSVQDFRLAFRDVEPAATLKDLNSFCNNVKDSPLEWDLQYPLHAESEIYKSSPFMQPSSASMVPGEDADSSVNGGTRPEWMDEDLIFPPTDHQDFPGPSSEKQSSAVDDQKITAVADVIIGDDDEDVAEFQSISCPDLRPVQTSSTVPSSPTKTGSGFAWPRKLKGISIVNGQVVPTTQAKLVPVQSRLPVELKPPKEVKMSHLTTASPEKKGKRDSRKAPVVGPPPAKKQRTLSPEKISFEKPVLQEVLKIKISKSGKKDKIKSEISEVPFSPPKTATEAVSRVRTPPEAREDLPASRRPHHSFPPPMAELATESVSRGHPPSIKLKSTPVFAEAWKKEKKERSEKAKSAKDRRSDKDREKEREIKRELERVKERELEAELQLAALSRPLKHKKSIDSVYSEPAAKKQKKIPAPAELVTMPSQLLPMPQLWSQQAGPPLFADLSSGAKNHPLEEDSSRKKSDKKRAEGEKKHGRRTDDVHIKKEVVADRPWLMPLCDQPATSHEGPRAVEKIKARENFSSETFSTSRLASHEFLPQKDSVQKPHSNLSIPKLTIPKLTLKIGGKEIKSVKSSSHSSVKRESIHLPEFTPPSQSLPTPKESHYPPATQTPLFYDNQLAAPLDLSMSSRSAPAQHTKPPKSSSKSKSSHEVPSKGHSSTPVSRPPAAVVVEIPRLPTPPPPAPVTPPKVVDVAPPVEVEMGNSKIWICPPCGKPDDGSPMVGCDMCDEWYHYPCVGLLAEPTVEQWYCPSCVDKQLKKNKKSKKR